MARFLVIFLCVFGLGSVLDVVLRLNIGRDDWIVSFSMAIFSLIGAYRVPFTT
jgi:hypothetical protein